MTICGQLTVTKATDTISTLLLLEFHEDALVFEHVEEEVVQVVEHVHAQWQVMIIHIRVAVRDIAKEVHVVAELGHSLLNRFAGVPRDSLQGSFVEDLRHGCHSQSIQRKLSCRRVDLGTKWEMTTSDKVIHQADLS